jgi:uncharacterized protein YdaU (DUF1376 family)
MKPPAFQFYANEYLAGTIAMSPAEVGAYIRLLCYQWSNGSIPDDPKKLKRIVGGPVSADVLAKFKPAGDGQLANQRLELERQKQTDYREKQRQKGIQSGVARRTGNEPRLNSGSPPVRTGSQPEPEPTPQPQLQPKPNSSSLSQSPSLSPEKRNTTPKGELPSGCASEARAQGNQSPNRTRAEIWPTLAQAMAVAELRSIPGDCAEKWWLEHDARGGLDARGQPIARWESSLQAYAVAWRANHQRDRHGRGGNVRPRGVPEPRQIAEDIAMPIFFDPSKIKP